MTLEESWRAFDRMLSEHQDHQWWQIGSCVYCKDCDVPLYRGDLPKERRA